MKCIEGFWAKGLQAKPPWPVIHSALTMDNTATKGVMGQSPGFGL
jgi:hypothetical protein